jgi:two-component system, chemotaxis family, chemotaxis protein CheY
MAKTIMVVDDTPDVRATVKAALESGGFKVVTAVNADDCLKKVNQAKPALILMDIMMPGTPVISVVRTSEAEKEDLMKSKNIKGFIQKPFDVLDLLKQVKKLAK